MRKRNAAIVAVLAVLMLFNCIAYAGATDSLKTSPVISTLTDVNCQAQDNQVQISMYLNAYKGYKVTEFKNPFRIVVDIPNADFPQSQQQINVKSNWVKSVRYAQNDKNLVRVVVDTIGKPQYFAEEKNGRLILYVVQPLVSGLNYYTDDAGTKLMLSGIQLTKNKNGKNNYTEAVEQGGLKYTLTFPSVSGRLESKLIKLNDGLFNSIQVLKNTKTKQTSITILAKTKLNYGVYNDSKLNRAGIIISRSTVPDRGEENRGAENRDGETPPVDASTPPPAPAPVMLGVEYSKSGNKDIVDIVTGQYKNYNILRLTDGDRIVVDIPGAQAPADEQLIPVDSGLVKSIRYAQWDSNTARVVIDTTQKVQYHVAEKTGRLSLTIETPNLRNIYYYNTGDRVYVRLDGAKLTQGDKVLTKYYSESFDETGLKYTVTFPNSYADIGTGVINVGDAVLDSIEIVQNDSSPTTSIIFNAKDKFIYNIITRTIPSVATPITILKPASNEDKLVVIDPGHGDYDPGAVVGDLKEKDLNLDIALRLNALLKSKNVKTYMIRQDDRFVGLYERTYIANKLNAALFLSIHNNAYYASYAGSETLYSSNNSNNPGLSKKGFASIIQQSMINTLGTNNLKTILRDDLVVVRETNMPSALAEVAFMTNKGDRTRLLTEDFRQNAAQALCDAIIQALEKQ